MHKLYLKIVAFIIVLSMLIYFLTGSRQGIWSKLGALNVVCITSMIADATRAIGGDAVFVQQLMGPGIDPHLYRASESDVYALSSADLIFYSGLHLEGKMGEILKNMHSSVPTIAVADALPPEKLIESEFDGIYDPHVWHDAALWIKAVGQIRDGLIKYDPDYTDYYKERAEEYIGRMQLLDKYVRALVQTIPKEKRILVTAHDAFEYFGRAYGFKVVGLQGINTDAQVSTKDVQNVADFIVEKKVPAIFLESSIPDRNIQAVQKAVESRGWNVAIAPEIFSDALGNPGTTAGTYHGMIKHNIETITSALKQ